MVRALSTEAAKSGEGGTLENLQYSLVYDAELTEMVSLFS